MLYIDPTARYKSTAITVVDMIGRHMRSTNMSLTTFLTQLSIHGSGSLLVSTWAMDQDTTNIMSSPIVAQRFFHQQFILHDQFFAEKFTSICRACVENAAFILPSPTTHLGPECSLMRLGAKSTCDDSREPATWTCGLRDTS